MKEYSRETISLTSLLCALYAPCSWSIPNTCHSSQIDLLLGERFQIQDHTISLIRGEGIHRVWYILIVFHVFQFIAVHITIPLVRIQMFPCQWNLWFRFLFACEKWWNWCWYFGKTNEWRDNKILISDRLEIVKAVVNHLPHWVNCWNFI